MNWNGWPVERQVYLFLGIAYLAIGVQVTLYHWRAAFRHKLMYGPVIVAPLTAIAALLYALAGAGGGFMVLMFLVAALSGLVGTVMHLQGVARMVGGFTLRNLAMGPPFILPIVFAALGIFGWIVHNSAGGPGG